MYTIYNNSTPPHTHMYILSSSQKKIGPAPHWHCSWMSSQAATLESDQHRWRVSALRRQQGPAFERAIYRVLRYRTRVHTFNIATCLVVMDRHSFCWPKSKDSTFHVHILIPPEVYKVWWQLNDGNYQTRLGHSFSTFSWKGQLTLKQGNDHATS